MDELAESFGKPIVQNNGTMVLKKTGNFNAEKIVQDINRIIEDAKKKPIKNIKLPKEDKGVIHHNIETYGFSEDEISEGFAVRFSANYGVVIRIYDGNYENLLYTIIKKWRLK